jgi:ParB family chromosome partitioning protein
MSKQKDKAMLGMLAGVTAGEVQAKEDRHRAAEAARGRTVTLIALDAVHDRGEDTRPAKAAEVLSLAESIVAVGLLQPPAVDKHHRLVAGKHRICACRLLLTPPAGRLDFLSAVEGFNAEEMGERIAALPPVDGLPEPLPAGRIPVRVLTDLDAEADPAGALAAEAAENTARKQYTASEVRALAARLIKAGFTETQGRPRRGEKAVRPALSQALGMTERHIRRLINEDGGKEVSIASALCSLRRAAVAMAELEIPGGRHLADVRDIAAAAGQIAAAIEAIDLSAINQENT